MTDIANPYLAPGARLTEQTEVEEFGEVGLFRNTRIGRIRYMAYGMAATMLFGFAGVLLGALLGAFKASGAAVVVFIAVYAGMAIFHAWLAVRRSRDFNVTGWLALLIFVPLANLVFLFVPGTDGSNRFGPKPPPNKGAGIFVVLAFLVIAVIGILAAIAIPAYQDYVKRAHAAQELSQQR